MDYPYLKKHLGEGRLGKEIESLEKGAWVDTKRKRENVIWMVYTALEIIDKLIEKNELVTNFAKWVREAKESKDLKDCLFELTCIDALSKNNKIIIKQKNGKKVPDAFITNENIYVEMTNLKDIPESIKLKVNDLCEKSLERFGSERGIHLIGIKGFFEGPYNL